MSSGLRFGLLFASLLVLITVIYTVVKRKLNIKYSVVWILWALFSFLMSVFPNTFYSVSRIFGIELPVNAVFLIMIGLLYALVLYVYITISKHNEEIIKLTYEVAILKKELEDLKKKKRNK